MCISFSWYDSKHHKKDTCMTPKRKAVEELILKTITMQDPSGFNTKIYQDKFAKLDDVAFDAWMQSLKTNRHAKMTLFVPPLKVVLTMEACFKTAKFLGIELFERLRLWDPVGKRFCLTPQKYLILRLPVRRLKQYLMDGLSVPESDKRLNPLTDQVVKPDKSSAISFPQAQMIEEKGLTTTLQELMTIRGGDLEAYSRMKAEIEEGGQSDSSVLVGTQGLKAAHTLRSFLTAMHLSSNI
jgi:hypothetical protein